MPGTGGADGCELPYGCWELNLGFLQEQLVFLAAQPFLQPQYFKYYFIVLAGGI